MTASITLTGLAASDPVPGSYVEVSFAQGDASLGTGTYGALIIANKSTSGSATADTVIYSPTSQVPLVTDADAIALFGTGSPAYRMWRRFVRKNPITPVSVICPAESGGVAATGTITYATTSTGAGTTRVWVGEEYVDVAIASGDNVTTIALNVSNAINAKTLWPVTSSPSAGVITLTWRTKGPQGNWGRYSATITSGIGTTVTPGTVTFMSSGATADSYTTVLSTILPYRYYYIIAEQSPVSGSATNTAAIITQMNTQAQPITGIRQRLFCGSVDTLANTTTFATGQNATRGEVAWLQNGDRPPEEMAADLAAIYALEELPVKFRCNFSGYGNDAQTALNWDLLAPRSGTAPTRANLVSALNNGITPVGVNANGTTYLVKRITMRSLNGSTSDYRIRDAHKVTVLDRLADDLNTKVSLQLSGKKIGNDPATGERIPGNDVVTPRVFRALIIKLLRDYQDNDLIENVDDTISAMTVQRETSPTTRMTARIPVDCIDVCDQFASVLPQVG